MSVAFEMELHKASAGAVLKVKKSEFKNAVSSRYLILVKSVAC